MRQQAREWTARAWRRSCTLAAVYWKLGGVFLEGRRYIGSSCCCWKKALGIFFVLVYMMVIDEQQYGRKWYTEVGGSVCIVE